MNTLHISTADTIGGAAKSAFRLHQGLLKAGHHSRMLVGFQKERRPDISSFPKRNTALRRLKYRTVGFVEKRFGLQYLLFPWRNELFDHPFIKEADLINLHNIHGGFFSHTVLPRLTSEKPVIWTLHDPWGMTGHCSYPQVFGCDRWLTGCGKCPALDDYPEISIDTTAPLWNVKNRVYRKSKLTIVAPSKWLADMARESPLLNRFPIRYIPYGLDTELYTPAPKRESRMSLGLPLDKKIVLFVAHIITGPRKGLGYLLEALKRVNEKPNNLLLVTMGEGEIPAQEMKGLSHRHLPFTPDEISMAKVYSSADVYVSPTLADNLPNTVMEAMACGTPVAAFAVGGLPDLVKNGETGYLVPPKDVEGLAAVLRKLLEDGPTFSEMGLKARQLLDSQFSLRVQAERYLKVYEEAMSGSSQKTSV